MVDLQTILKGHRTKLNRVNEFSERDDSIPPSFSEIPDLFFDKILVEFKLSRPEVLVLMYLYRKVWQSKNIFRKHGISELLSHTEMANSIGLSIEEIHQSLIRLEEYSFIEIIRSGQYFVRKYFLREYDEHFSQTYDDFES